MEDETLYDEFGNYIGPELDEDDDAEYLEQQQQNQEYEEQEEEEHNGAQQEEQVEIVTEENRVVLHEDKQYYPEMEELYPEAENMVQQEDQQLITEPIIAPIKSKDFDIVEKTVPETNFNYEYVQNLMDNPELVRNVAIVGHLHHGKTGLMDLLVQQTHERNWRLDKEYKYTDSRKDEQERLVSIKASPMTLVLPDERGKNYLMNLFDTPGHVNFSDEMCCALRISDGIVLVVDAVEGVMLGTERTIKYCVQNKIAITVFVNKIDRLILELKLPPADAYLKIKHTLEEINGIIQSAAYNVENKEDLKISPLLGNVCFGSSRYGFCFTIQSFAKMYALSYKIDPVVFTKLLWGNYYFDRDTRKFSKKPSQDYPNRVFVDFILEPIYKIFSHSCSKEKEDLKPLLHQLGIYLKKSWYSIDTKPLMKLIFQEFLGCTSPLVGMCSRHIPSVKQGNIIKVEQNYTGDRSTDVYKEILKCDKNGPLVINIVKQYNKPDCLSFDVFGRVISGTINRGQQVKVLGEAYNLEDQEDMTVKQVKNVWIYQSRYRVEVDQVKAGSWVLIEGIDQSIAKSATIISLKEKAPIEILKPIKHNTTPVMKVAIEPLIPSELPKMLEGLRKVNRSYPLLITKVEESGEHILISTGELYLDCVLHDLRKMYSEIEIKVSDPSVSFCETVIDTSGIKCYAETPNKMNKITMIASPLDKGLADDIEREIIDLDMGKKKVSKYFQDNFEWDLLASRSVWSFGPGKFGPNLLMDDTLPSETDKQILSECKETIVQGFQWAAREGPLCDEPVRNVKFKIIEADMAKDLIYRGVGQIIPTARRTCYSSFLMATPRIQEPQLLVEIQTTADALEAIYTVLGRRRGHMISETAKPGSPLYTVKAHIPAIDSFGFETDLRVHTSGQAFCLSVFDQWELLPGDPLDKNIKLSLLEPSPPQDLAREFMIKTRRRKGLNENVSIVKYFDDPNILEALKEDKDYKDYI